MKRTHQFMLALSLLLGATAAHAQLYKWTGPDGKVTYSDSPPPSSIKKVETKSLGGSGVDTAGLPFELAEAVRNNPVTLYSSTKCPPCDDGRKMLNTRGIPFAEKTVTTDQDIAQFRKLGNGQVPMLMIGRGKHTGFDSSEWGPALTAAGYPETSKLPAGYRNPAPEAAVPAAPKPETTASKPAEELPPATGNAPPGFRF